MEAFNDSNVNNNNNNNNNNNDNNSNFIENKFLWIFQFPRELFALILEEFKPKDLLIFSNVCKYTRFHVLNDRYFESICRKRVRKKEMF